MIVHPIFAGAADEFPPGYEAFLAARARSLAALTGSPTAESEGAAGDLSEGESVEMRASRSPDADSPPFTAERATNDPHHGPA